MTICYFCANTKPIRGDKPSCWTTAQSLYTLLAVLQQLKLAIAVRVTQKHNHNLFIFSPHLCHHSYCKRDGTPCGWEDFVIKGSMYYGDVPKAILPDRWDMFSVCLCKCVNIAILWNDTTKWALCFVSIFVAFPITNRSLPCRVMNFDSGVFFKQTYLFLYDVTLFILSRSNVASTTCTNEINTFW